jgi:hypothetical protein
MILVIGEALGYVARAFREKYPSAMVLSGFCSSFFHARRVFQHPEDSLFCWHPGSGESFRAFLERNIGDADIGGLRIVEWEPAFVAYPDEMRGLLADAAQFGREAAGSVITTGFFGRRWIKNCIRNFLLAENSSVLDECRGPVLVAASGPGLSDALPTIRRYRDRLSLWALPSALDFLDHHGIDPDLIVLTDPGFHSGLHFRTPCRRHRETGKGPPVLFPLTAFVPSSGAAFSGVIFHQGTAVETCLLERFRPETFYHPANGTVAGSAVGIARAKSAFPVFVAGLDFAVKDTIEHARPNAFDRDAETENLRLHPLETEKYSRMIRLYPEKVRDGFRTSPSLRTYAGWFAARKFPGLHRIAPSVVETGIPEAGTSGLESLPRVKPVLRLRPLPLPGKSERAAMVASLLDDVGREIRTARTLRELSPRFRDTIMMIAPEDFLAISSGGGKGEAGEVSGDLREKVTAFIGSLRPLAGVTP